MNSSHATDGVPVDVVLPARREGAGRPARLVRAALGGDFLRPRWSSATALLYAGMLVLLLATVELVDALAAGHGDGALFGFVTLVVLTLSGAAFGLRRLGEDVAAGVVAFVAVIATSIWIGSFLEWIGFSPDAWGSEPFLGIEPSTVVLELMTIATGLLALAFFRAPLLALPVAVVFWYGIVDLVGGEGRGGPVAASIVVGLLLVGAAVAVERPSRRPVGFWLHATGALAIGGAVVAQWHDSHLDWLVVGLVACAFLAGAYTLGRSVYAVLAIAGLLATASHFIAAWYEGKLLGPLYGEFAFDGAGAPLLYALVGAAFVALGLALERTGVPTVHPGPAEDEPA